MLEDVKKHVKQVQEDKRSFTICKEHSWVCEQWDTTKNIEITCFSFFKFIESWRLLVDWMTEVEQTLDTHKEIGASHEEIKQQLIEQKVDEVLPVY